MFADVLKVAVNNWMIERATPLRVLTEGKSGAYVAIVHIQSREDSDSPDVVPSGEYILKLDVHRIWDPPELSEWERHKRAEGRSPRFARHHIPGLVRYEVEDGRMAMLYDIAGRGVSNLLTPESLDAQSLIAQATQIASAFLVDLNDRPREISPVSAAKILDSWLGYRLKAPRLLEFVASQCADRNYLLWAERIYVNPLWFCHCPQLAEETSIAIHGLLHGDLHPGNIMLDRSRPASPDFWVIDFALSFEGPVGYDHAYLEIALIIRQLRSSGPERLHHLLNAIESGTASVPQEDYSLFTCLQAMRDQLEKWKQEKYSKFGDSIDGQFILSRVAAALNWVNKPMDEASRQIALRYGSWAATQYLKRFHRDVWSEIASSAEAMAVPKASPVLDDATWDAIKTSLGNLDRRTGKFILVTGKLNEGAAAVSLGLLPWSAVIDFDPASDKTGLYSVVNPLISKLRPVELFGQIPSLVDYDRGTGWLMASGWERNSEGMDPGVEWDWVYPACIRGLLTSMQEVRASQPVYVVVLADTIDAHQLQLLLHECVSTLRGNAQIVFLSKTGEQPRHVKSLFRVTVPAFLHAITSKYGTSADVDSPQLPGKQGMVSIPIRDLRHLEEDFEILHSRVVETESQQTRPVQDDFWYGNPPTYADLAAGLPLPRAVYTELKDKVTKPLENPPNRIIVFTHGPGVGGTTLSLKLAWDLHEYFPTVILRRYSRSTADRLDHLFHLTEKAILLIVDSSILPEPDREDLYREAAQRHLRLVILYVLRAASKRLPSDQQVNLPDEMTKEEAVLFRDAFSARTKDPERLKELELVATSDLAEWKVYRSPFFFGLITFQEQYKPILTYVKNCISSASFPVQKVLRFLALITRYTQNAKYNQAGLSEHLIAKLLDKPLGPELEIRTLLGDGAERLVVRHDGILRMRHPLLAEQALKVLVGGEHWKAGLKDLALDFLRELHRCLGPNIAASQVLLENLFVRRYDFQSERGDVNRHFAPLIVAIGPPDGSKDGQQEIFAELTKRYPTQGHFWNHRARHLIYAMHQHYELAVEYINKAIALDKKEMVHYHTKGLVYRFWINDDLLAMFKQGAQPTPEILLDAIRDRAREAFRCFELAESINQNGKYPLVTRVQLTIEIAEKLARGFNNDLTILGLLQQSGPVSRWLEEHLSLAEDSLDVLKRLRADSEPSRFESDCESGIEKLYGNFDDMVRIWETLLQGSKDRDEGFVRRNLAAAYLNRNSRNWEGMSSLELEQISEMMEKNLASDPTNARDIRTWFQAHRRLPSFSPHSALDRLSKWAKVHESVEAHYYLYIVQFLIWRKSRSIIGEEQILFHMKRCRELAEDRGDYCYEWLGREPVWCPLVDHRVLGRLNRRPLPLFEDTSSLQRFSGTTDKEFSRQGGIVRLSNRLQAYFVPTEEIYEYKDQQKEINFFLGFSYVGLRAWDVLPGPVTETVARPQVLSPAKAAGGAPAQTAGDGVTAQTGSAREPLSQSVPRKLYSLVAASGKPMRLSDIGEALNKAFPNVYKLYLEAGYPNLKAMVANDKRLVLEGLAGKELVRVK